MINGQGVMVVETNSTLRKGKKGELNAVHVSIRGYSVHLDDDEFSSIAGHFPITSDASWLSKAGLDHADFVSVWSKDKNIRLSQE